MRIKQIFFFLGYISGFVWIFGYLDFAQACRLQAHSHGAIATAICFSQLIGCMEFSIVVAIAVCEHLRAVQMVIATVIFSSQQIIGCMGFSVSVHLVSL